MTREIALDALTKLDRAVVELASASADELFTGSDLQEIVPVVARAAMLLRDFVEEQPCEEARPP